MLRDGLIERKAMNRRELMKGLTLAPLPFLVGAKRRPRTAREFYLRAMKELPEEFVDKDTRTAFLDCNSQYKMYAANPRFAPIVYDGTKWKDLVIKHE